MTLFRWLWGEEPYWPNGPITDYDLRCWPVRRYFRFTRWLKGLFR